VGVVVVMVGGVVVGGVFVAGVGLGEEEEEAGIGEIVPVLS
jgi:hypothetical protein